MNAATTGLNGSVITMAVFLALIGAGLLAVAWHVDAGEAKGRKRRSACERLAAVVFAAAAFTAVIGLTPLLAPVWQVTGKGTGVVALVSAVFLTGLFAFLMVVRGKAHHWQGSSAVAVLFATGTALVIGGWRSVTAAGTKAAAGAGRGLAGFISGHPAHPAHTSGSPTVLYGFYVVAAVFAVVFIRGYLQGAGKMKPRARRGRGHGQNQALGRAGA
jgi:hypothetical protein